MTVVLHDHERTLRPVVKIALFGQPMLGNGVRGAAVAHEHLVFPVTVGIAPDRRLCFGKIFDIHKIECVLKNAQRAEMHMRVAERGRYRRAAEIDPFCLAVARRDAAFIAEPHDVTALYRHRGVNAVFLFAGDESGVRIKLHNLIPFTSKMGSMQTWSIPLSDARGRGRGGCFCPP